MPDSGSHVWPAYASEVEMGSFARFFPHRVSQKVSFETSLEPANAGLLSVAMFVAPHGP